VLRGIDLAVERGEFLAIAGHTGAGKSTLCYTLNGLVPHSFGGKLAGTVRVCGLNTAEATLPALARKVGIVLQSAESQLVGLTAAEDVEFGLENLGLPAPEILERARWALEVVRLSEHADRSPWTLSGGQKQREAIAAALAFRPEVLVLDNPTAELDPLGKEEVLETVARLNREMGITIVIVDQELHEVIPHATRLALLDEGRIALLGTPAEVLDQAQAVRAIGVKLPDVTEVAYQLRKASRWDGALPVTVSEAVAGLRGQDEWQGTGVWGQGFGLRGDETAGADGAGHGRAPQAENVTHYASRITDPAPLIQVENLAFRYPGGQEALAGVTLDIRQGEFVALMGPNGAGKTTLAKHFNGLLKPSGGRVLVHGADTRERTVAQLAPRVGYVFQNPDHQIFSQTVAEELAFGPKNLGWPAEKIEAAVEKTLADLGLAEQREAEPFFMGLAERKLIAIGSVLIMGPEVLVLDEPATGADYGVALRIMRYIRDLHQGGLTVVIITHDVSLAANYADRLLVMRAGRLALDGRPHDLLGNPDPSALRACYVTPPQVSDLARALWGEAAPPIIRVEAMVAALTPRPTPIRAGRERGEGLGVGGEA
jgi:energy-coupling factor transport system ATP-binding protein